MNNYGKAALRAVQLYATGLYDSPEEAWLKAVSEIFGVGSSSAKKACPKNAFLGLCEEGSVKGIPHGSYTRSEKNKRYALAAVAELKRNPQLVDDPNLLWKIIMAGESKAHNSQMDVVTALWEHELIV